MSPSSLGCYEKDKEEYYLRYLAHEKPPNPPQTKPMSVGSAFDAQVKAFLHKRFVDDANPAYTLDALFETQVESQNRDFAGPAGEYVFECYRSSGALADLILELNTIIGVPSFEFTLSGLVHSDIGAIPVSGKPDIYFINRYGAKVMYDWKVNGYCGKANVSPRKGYLKVRDAFPVGCFELASRNQGMHKDCVPMNMLGININSAIYLESADPEWAKQLTIYGWMVGEEVGSKLLIKGIDQIVHTGKVYNGRPLLRVASHRSRVSVDFQYQLLGRLAAAWDIICSDHFFRDLSKEKSQEKCATLDRKAEALIGDGSDLDKYFAEACRSY